MSAFDYLDPLLKIAGNSFETRRWTINGQLFWPTDGARFDGADSDFLANTKASPLRTPASKLKAQSRSTDSTIPDLTHLTFPWLFFLANHAEIEFSEFVPNPDTCHDWQVARVTKPVIRLLYLFEAFFVSTTAVSTPTFNDPEPQTSSFK